MAKRSFIYSWFLVNMSNTSSEAPWRDKALLVELHDEKGLSASDISDELGCGRRTVTDWLYKLDVKEPSGSKPYHDEEKCRYLYEQMNLSTEDLAERWNSSEITIERWLRRHNIARSRAHSNPDAPWRDEETLKSLFFEKGLTHKEIGEELGCGQSTVTKWMEKLDIKGSRETPWKDRSHMADLHLEQGLSPPEMSEELGISESAVERWLDKLNIARKSDAPWTNEELLELLYLERDLTTEEIGEELGCADSTIRRWLMRYDIEKSRDYPWRDKETLKKLYVQQEKSLPEIAEQFDCDSGTVREWLHRHDIEVRRVKGGPYESKELLERLYVKQQMSVVEIAEKLDCNHSTIGYWLGKHGIETRGSSSRHRNLENDSSVEEEYPHRDPDLLHHLYIEEEKSISDIASELGTDRTTIRKYLHRHNLYEESEEFNISDIDYDVPEDSPWKDGELVRLLYEEHDVSTTQMAEIFDCSSATTSTWLDKHDIETRRRYDRPSKVELRRLYHDKGLSASKIAHRLDVNATTVYRWLREAGIETKDISDYLNEKLKDEDLMRHLYVEEQLSVIGICREINSSLPLVKEWLLRHGIELRDRTEEISGENHPHWKGGQSPYGEGWTEQKRSQVLERDNHRCQSCGVRASDHQEEHGSGLHIHHIIPASEFSNPAERNDISNLVALCSSCHRKWEGIPVKPTLNSD